MPAPTASITATPSSIDAGQSSTLSWTTANATQVKISGLGTVAATGSQSITPDRSTDYTITATGANSASVQATARVTVTQPAPKAAIVPSATDEELFTQNIHDVYFDYDKYDLRAADKSAVEEDATFLNSHPGMKTLIEGHCDDRGSEEYNLALGESRAETMKKALITAGVDASRVKTISYGKEKPFCTEETDSCWQQNRRDHLKLDR
jgi:peptidoglycan-associated lipoprotein